MSVRELGYPARACETAKEALVFTLHPGGVQCLMADLGLSDMDGGELIERRARSWSNGKKVGAYRDPAGGLAEAPLGEEG